MAKKAMPKRANSSGKNAPKRRANQTAQPSLRVWVIASVVITFFAGGVIYLDKFNKHNPDALIHQVLTHPQQNTDAKNDPNFAFYTALPSGKLTLMPDKTSTNNSDNNSSSTNKPAIVISSNETVSGSIPAVKTETIATDKTNYFLQVAAFANYTDADKLRASLLLNDFNANTAQYVSKGKTWFRVVVGPYQDLKTFNLAQKQLTKLHYQAIRLESQ